MLIIFDLDDTLIETSKDLFLKRYRDLFFQLDLDGFSNFLQINKTSVSSLVALKQFFFERNLPPTLFQDAKDILDSPLPFDWNIRPTSHALPLLQKLTHTHTLALVSYGMKNRQLEKMKKAGIQNHLFSTILCVDAPGKKGDAYAHLLQKYTCAPKRSLVCGDRVVYDLVPASALGMTTVHYPHGRGSNLSYDDFTPDFIIKKLSGLYPVIEGICYG